jgi:DNA-binding protein H-NS
MARPKSLTSLSIEALLKLRDDVATALSKRAGEMKDQLMRLGSATSGRAAAGTGRRGRGGPLKGRKVAPKYRGPGGETWAGRGARPRWLMAALKNGKKLDDFLIAKSAAKSAPRAKARRKRKAKR